MLDELRRKYGSKYVPEGKTLNEILNSVPSSVYAYTHYDVYMGVKDADHAVTPRELQDLVRRYFVRALNKAILTDMAETAAQEGYIRPEDVVRLIAFRNCPSDESWIGKEHA